jgi:hypothetical protein
MSSKEQVFVKKEPLEIIVIDSSDDEDDGDETEDGGSNSIIVSDSSSDLDEEEEQESVAHEGLKHTVANPLPPPELPSVLTWNGYPYTIKDRIPDKSNSGVWKGRYWCSIYRSTRRGNGCKARLKVTYNPWKEQKISIDASDANHICQRPVTKPSSPQDVENESLICARVLDARDEMKSLCEKMALADRPKSAVVIANEVINTTAQKYEDKGE